MRSVSMEVLYNYVYPGKIPLDVDDEVLDFVGRELRWKIKEKVWEGLLYPIFYRFDNRWG